MIFTRRHRDPFAASLLARPAWHRLGVLAAVILALWIAVAWAVALP